jgi:hypothetical protein
MGKVLYVWENGRLHNKQSHEFEKVAWSSDEFDAVTIDGERRLVISKYTGTRNTASGWEIVAVILPGYYQKYSIEVEPDVEQGSIPESPYFDSGLSQDEFTVTTDGGTERFYIQQRETIHESELPHKELSEYVETILPDEPFNAERSAPPFPTETPTEPLVTRVDDDPPFNTGEHVTVITPAMREQVLAKLDEHVKENPLTAVEDVTGISVTSTNVLGLADTTQPPVLGQKDVFSNTTDK